MPIQNILRKKKRANEIKYADISWEKGACNGLPTEFFYKIEDRGVLPSVGMEAFRAICTPCPIWAECLGYAANNEDFGVWGGMNSGERAAIMERGKASIASQVIADFSKYGVSRSMILEAIGRK
jgi:hypothetical protein